MMDRLQYLIVLAACLAVTGPLELFGAGVYRQPWRVVRAIVPVAVGFLIWDAIAIATHVWTYNPRYITGFRLPGGIPIEEVLFFVVIPLCGLLTYGAVTAMLERHAGRKARTARRLGALPREREVPPPARGGKRR